MYFRRGSLIPASRWAGQVSHAGRRGNPHWEPSFAYLFLIIWKLVFMYGHYIHPRIIFCSPNLFQAWISLIVISIQLKKRAQEKKKLKRRSDAIAKGGSQVLVGIPRCRQCRGGSAAAGGAATRTRGACTRPASAPAASSLRAARPGQALPARLSPTRGSPPYPAVPTLAIPCGTTAAIPSAPPAVPGGTNPRPTLRYTTPRRRSCSRLTARLGRCLCGVRWSSWDSSMYQASTILPPQRPRGRAGLPARPAPAGLQARQRAGEARPAAWGRAVQGRRGPLQTHWTRGSAELSFEGTAPGWELRVAERQAGARGSSPAPAPGVTRVNGHGVCIVSAPL